MLAALGLCALVGLAALILDESRKGRRLMALDAITKDTLARHADMPAPYSNTLWTAKTNNTLEM